MVYNVIGLMSGSSLDGLDIAFCRLEEVRGLWSYEIIHAECIPYTNEMTHDLQHIAYRPVADFLRLNTALWQIPG